MNVPDPADSRYPRSCCRAMTSASPPGSDDMDVDHPNVTRTVLRANDLSLGCRFRTARRSISMTDGRRGSVVRKRIPSSLIGMDSCVRLANGWKHQGPRIAACLEIHDIRASRKPVRVAGMDSARVLGRGLNSHALRVPTPNRVNTPACTAPAIIDARSRRCNFGDRLRIERFRRLGNGTRTGETLTPSVGRPTHRPAATVAQRPPQLNARCRCSTALALTVDGW